MRRVPMGATKGSAVGGIRRTSVMVWELFVLEVRLSIQNLGTESVAETHRYAVAGRTICSTAARILCKKENRDEQLFTKKTEDA